MTYFTDATRKKSLCSTSKMDELLRALLQNMAYPKPRYQTGYVHIVKNAKQISIMALEDNPYIGIEPKYNVLRKQGYLVLILEKDIVFYKVDDRKKLVTIYAIVDQRQDYLSIIKGL